MNWIKCFVVSFANVWLIGCQQPTKESHTDKTTIDSLPEVQYRDILPTDTAIVFGDTHSSLYNTVDSLPRFTIREGTHNLSLQWISWEEMGKAEIKYLGDNTYSITGKQKSKINSDYLEVRGTLTPLSEKELIFDGTIEYQITHLNQGNPCVKQGKQTFKSTKNRKYWRMQDMQNCEGGGVTDYVDIYF